VIKVLWGRNWDPLLAKDHHGILHRLMDACVDGEYQNFKAKGGAYVREHFFGKHPETAAMVANMSDEDIWRLKRGGHDAQKVYAAYTAAMAHKGQPTVILAHTVKGFGLGKAAEGQMVAHQQKKMDGASLASFRGNLRIDLSDEDIAGFKFVKPTEDSEEIRYLKACREKLGGYLPKRDTNIPPLELPPLELFKPLLEGTGDREISTTMAFVRILTALLKDKTIGKNIVPIVPDEARTFGMEGLFRQIGIYSAVGQLYTPQDADQLMSYKEDKKGQMLEEGINEAGSTCSWIAAGTAYANHKQHMVPFYIYYSMFGFQRVGDFIWAAGDIQARGFLLGATAGRTTLAGEGLQHQDGHSQLVATTVPNCRAYDPAYAYELAVIIHDGMKKMYVEGANIFYYLSVMNENYLQPAMPEGAEEGILKGAHLIRNGSTAAPETKTKSKATAKTAGKAPRATLLGSGTILREVLAAAEMLEKDYQVAADVFSVTSFSELRREALLVERENLLHPERKAAVPYVAQLFGAMQAPVIAATDNMRMVPDQIRQWVASRFVTLGTDGFGRSDGRAALRGHFEVDRRFVVLAALKALAEDRVLDRKVLVQAVKKLGVDPAKANPLNS
jgi:pyruvate dehydrogenase E1 component